MAEVADAGEHHGDAGRVGGGDHLVVADAAAGLDAAVAPASIAATRPSAKGKKASEATTQGRLPACSAARRDGELHRVDAAGLAHADADGGAVARPARWRWT